MCSVHQDRVCDGEVRECYEAEQTQRSVSDIYRDIEITSGIISSLDQDGFNDTDCVEFLSRMLRSYNNELCELKF